MKLYYARGACSLADRISLHEAGFDATFERVDLKSKITETGANFMAINPKGYVPALVLDSGETLTENVAVLSWIASQAPELAPSGPLGHIRLLEALAFISSEVHKAFEPLFTHGAPGANSDSAAATIARRLDYIANTVGGSYLFGARFTVADAYLFVMLTWARKLGVTIPRLLSWYFEDVMERDCVRRALAEEDLIQQFPLKEDRVGAQISLIE
jgi:glutathione S-transferase